MNQLDSLALEGFATKFVVEGNPILKKYQWKGKTNEHGTKLRDHQEKEINKKVKKSEWLFLV